MCLTCASAMSATQRVKLTCRWQRANRSYAIGDGLAHCQHAFDSVPGRSKKTFDHNALLSEDLVREASRNATIHVNAAAARGHSLRITEANSMSGAGKDGVSDAYAAALWTADQAFEFAYAGVKSVSVHWGVGGLPDPKFEGGGGVPAYAGMAKHAVLY
eukprot:GHUV01034652.1.p1 GENE.GHUV01034652.1~~GHUV01034652.1.p1  ORF type:complete len:159 (-),score=11.46 GHUV01034652.1:17-493(-)